MDKDWMKRNHEELNQQANQTAGYLTENRLAQMGLNITYWMETEFTPKRVNLNAAFEAWLNPATRTPIITANLQGAEAAFIPVYRKLYTGFLRKNPLVTDADLIAMGLPKRPSGGRTPAADPQTSPVAEVRTPSPGVVELHYRDSTHEDGTRRKPAGVHGAEVRWAVLDAPPTDWAGLVNSSFDTATPFRLSFDGNARGRHLYFALRWENTRGAKGPWSEIASAIIP